MTAHEIRRFMKHVVRDPNSDCLLWNGYKDKDGYGRSWMGSAKDGTFRMMRANRFAWLMSGLEIPKNMWVLHTCDRPSCTNINHLFLGTNIDNDKDKARKQRGRKSKLGLPYGVRISGNKFEARVRIDTVLYFLGLYDTAEEAGRVAMAFKRQHYESLGWKMRD